MYILFVVHESHFSHTVVEGLRAWPITSPFGLGGAAGFLPSSGALYLPMRVVLPSRLQGRDADSTSALSSTARLRPRGHNAIKIRLNGRVQGGICVQSHDMGSSRISFLYLVFSPGKMQQL